MLLLLVLFIFSTSGWISLKTSYLNKLPTDFKNSESVKGFKINSEKIKVASISGNANLNGQFGELANEVLQ